MKTYRTILLSALSATFKHPWLLIFGFLAAFLTSFGESGVAFRKMVNLPTDGLTLSDWRDRFLGIFNLEFLSNFGASAINSPGTFSLMILTFLAIFLLGFLFIYLAIRSQCALIIAGNQLSEADAGCGARDAWRKAKGHFWAVLILNIFVTVAAAAVLAVFWPITLNLIDNGAQADWLYWLIYVAYFLINLCLYFGGLYAINYAVLKNKHWTTSLGLGFKLFFKNFLVSAEMAVILFISTLLTLLIGFIVFTVLYSLVNLLVSLVPSLDRTSFPLITFFSLFGLTAILLGAWLTIFKVMTWTSLFLRLQESSVSSKLGRMFARK